MEFQPPSVFANVFVRLSDMVIVKGARQAVAYLSPTLIVKMTRGHRARKPDKSVSVVLTMGKPNFRERQFVKACQKAGEPFPVKKVQVRWFP